MLHAAGRLSARGRCLSEEHPAHPQHLLSSADSGPRPVARSAHLCVVSSSPAAFQCPGIIVLSKEPALSYVYQLLNQPKAYWLIRMFYVGNTACPPKCTYTLNYYKESVYLTYSSLSKFKRIYRNEYFFCQCLFSNWWLAWFRHCWQREATIKNNFVWCWCALNLSTANFIFYKSSLKKI